MSKNLVSDIFGNNFNQYDTELLSLRAILTPQNEDARALNELVLIKLGGELATYFAIDEIDSEEGDCDKLKTRFPVKYLNSLNPAGKH